MMLERLDEPVEEGSFVNILLTEIRNHGLTPIEDLSVDAEKEIEKEDVSTDAPEPGDDVGENIDTPKEPKEVHELTPEELAEQEAKRKAAAERMERQKKK